MNTPDIIFDLASKVDCEWGKWVIGECSEECGGGVQINFREKIQEELFGGKTCDGVATQELDCNTNSCPGIEI